MAKIAFIIGMLVAMLFGNANGQSKSDKLYDNFSGKEGFSTLGLSKSMIDVIDMTIDNDDGEEKKVTGDLNRIRVLYYNDGKGDLSAEEFGERVLKFFDKNAYHRIEDDDDDDDNTEVEMRYLGTKKKVKEFHMVMWGDGGLNAVVSFYGDMDVEQVDELKELGIGVAEK